MVDLCLLSGHCVSHRLLDVVLPDRSPKVEGRDVPLIAPAPGPHGGDMECLPEVLGLGPTLARRSLFDEFEVIRVDHDGCLPQGHMVMVPPPPHEPEA